ncbi:MAG: LacI family DNA-binding transcriptional regulator [Xanthomonadales bacterium]|nr:LacI family transcriptional regulator [Gammaproteobacteria bacterium]MBT8055223.1 LacI family transcriptional regulator [Gammaproteobacteria bacterium]NND56947.1 LacI family DNA-binding transcriptional regulator [Xanthomonadales bacterium]NNK51905.1 LacI family DNA-binding transcriptional regulator [Xanthomonadales bacterium]NNL94211.1 LacI family DNA-binding transcriptional regulator [Xanthomonadales bacterium]
MATIYEVSKLAGVSLATVSRVMNNSSRVSPKTRQKVLAAMQKLDYHPNTIAQSLASKRSNSVGVLVSELHGPIFGSLVSGIEEELTRAGKFSIFAVGHSDGEKEKDGINFLISRNCDALIFHLEASSDEFLLAQKNSALPFVIVNRLVSGLEENCISLNNVKGGIEATRFLLKQGHRDIAYISGPLHWGDAGQRLAGHKTALAEFGIPFDPNIMVEGDYLVQSGYVAMKQLFGRKAKFTAVICANDEMAVGAMDAIREQGLSMPEDISLVGFDNVRWAPFLSPKLTTVNNPVNEMGRMAARWVLKNVYGINDRPIQTFFEPEIVVRESAGARV